MILKQSTAYTRMFKMIASSDHIANLTGASPTVNISKAGAAFGAAGGTVTEVANGWYKIALTTTDTNTLGDLAYYITATSGDNTDFVDTVSVRLIDDAAFPATSGRSMVVDASGLVDANAVKLGPSGSGTAQTARDIGTSVLLSTGTGTGQLDFTSGVVKANATQLLGGTIPAPNVTGVPLVDLKYTLGTISPATAGSVRADAVTGAVGSVTGAVGSVTGAVGSVAGAVGSVTGNVGGNVVGSVASVTAGVTVTTNNDKTGYSLAAGQVFIKKNSGLNNFMFPMIDSADHVSLKTGLTITGQVSIDGASFGSLTNSASEIGTTGVYKINLAAADTNGTVLMFKFTSTGADARLIEVVTQT